jgi:MoxR-like ATPase
VTDQYPPSDPGGFPPTDPGGFPPSHPGAERSLPTPDDAREALLAVRDEIAKVVVGQDAIVSGLVSALLVRGHVLLEGVPGVAKTLLVTTLAAALDLDSRRLQFTPDLMPADVTGQQLLDGQGTGLQFHEGPVFTNLLLADEINRTPPRTQSALLEAMQERQVSVGGRSRPLPSPFLVVATQNPIEYEGTYPLPEAQLDRFLFSLRVDYPTEEQEREILARHDARADAGSTTAHDVRAVAGVDALDAARAAVHDVRVEPAVRDYVVTVCRATREAPAVSLGVSPRGSTMLLHAAKAWAWLSGRSYLTPDEVKAVARPTLRHRLQLRPEAELDGLGTDGVLDSVLASVPVPR